MYVRAIALVVAVLIGYYWHTDQVGRHERAIHEYYKSLYQAQALVVAEENNRLLLEEMAKREKDEKRNKAIIRELNSIIDGLHNRASRDKPADNAAGNTCAITGAELSREDAEFLARESARAERILNERNQYYLRYQEAKRSLDAFQGAASR